MSLSFSELRKVLGKSTGPVNLSDAYGLDLTTGKTGSEISLMNIKNIQTQPQLLQSFNPSARSSVLGIYSTRLLNANYAGPVLNVKRASDGTTVDFFTDLIGNLFDANNVNYSTWIGSSEGQVMKWYDQSGAGLHATATTGTSLIPPRLALDPAGSGKYVIFFPTEKINDPDLIIRVNALNTAGFGATTGFNSTGGTAPTFVGASGINGGGYVQFNPGSVQSSNVATQVLSFGQKTFNMNTKGFSATCRFMFTGTAAAWERIFDFGNGSPNDNIVLNRYSTSQSIQINYYTGTNIHFMVSTALFNQNTLYNIAVLYNPNQGTYGTFYLYINGVLSQSAAPVTPGTLVKAANRTLNTTYVGKSLTGVDYALNANIYSLRVYDRVLTETEIQDPSEYGVNYSGFTIATQAVGAMMCNFYGIENIHGWHTFLGSTGNLSLRASPTGSGQPYRIMNTNSEDLMNVVGGFAIYNGVHNAVSPYVSYTNSVWNTLAFSRASTTTNILYLGMPDPSLSYNGRGFHGYMTDLITFNAPLPTTGAAGETTFSPEYKMFHKLVGKSAFERGLVGRYVAESWFGSQWKDTSGAGNHATAITGLISKTSLASASGMAGGAQYLFGNTSASITFPAAILPATYTLFHVARYNGANQKRIFTHSSLNWLSGFWNGNSGIAYRGSKWLGNSTANRHGTDWVLSTDQSNLYRSYGAQRSTTGEANGSITTVSPLNLNYGIDGGSGLNDQSDWAAACVLVYNRQLSLAEYLLVEDYLASKYRIPMPIHEGLVVSLDASDYLTTDGTTWRDKTTNGYNFTLGSTTSWNNT